ncbi:hypothetical protein NEOLI_005432 [Neolecta irregularis DAH-3]|uniref:Uncharacterized protein n=1 Tax=Neolecta irregularis (strain DAH-3) TaxID=1198029 RepID=A0A1U7LTL3_NEOID|nr:hypothetical protein NEOLI_005432 [Neolecta irregularis DAH-3]|eukprot:OLL25969.1 hypothetical protein NEOLI_005432 [Neolecta irregularis DAH-3]
MVIPLCYAVFDIQWWRDSSLQELAGRSFGNKLDFMKWLGNERVVHGVKASNAMLVADAALERTIIYDIRRRLNTIEISNGLGSQSDDFVHL